MFELLIVLLIVIAIAVIGGVGYVVSGRRRAPEAPTERAPDTADAEAGVAVLQPPDVDVVEPETLEPEVVEAPPARPSFRERLAKARGAIGGYFGSILSRSKIDDETWDELEEALILADVGVDTTTSLLDRVKEQVSEQKLEDSSELLEVLKAEMKSEVGGRDIELARGGEPAVWLFVGVNGVGKTTTIGKLGKREVDEGRSVVMAAGDTFRAAAGEQLEMWADRVDATIVRGSEGADPSSVIFDAVEHASAREADLVLADTAGRLHTKTNLMEELRKVRRVAEKGAGTVTEVLLVIDATTGQNGLVQAQQFTEAVDVTGVVLTKLDGSAKGGIVMAIQSELGIPVKLVGLGETENDLVPFDSEQFVDALFE